MAIGNNDLIWPKKLLNADKKKNEPCDECCWLLGFVSIQQKRIPIKFSGRKKPIDCFYDRLMTAGIKIHE